MPKSSSSSRSRHSSNSWPENKVKSPSQWTRSPSVNLDINLSIQHIPRFLVWEEETPFLIKHAARIKKGVSSESIQLAQNIISASPSPIIKMLPTQLLTDTPIITPKKNGKKRSRASPKNSVSKNRPNKK
jgi:hypothetical protein